MCSLLEASLNSICEGNIIEGHLCPIPDGTSIIMDLKEKYLHFILFICIGSQSADISFKKFRLVLLDSELLLYSGPV